MVYMAPINCSECAKEISEEALLCPNCGFTNKIVKYNTPLYTIGKLSVVFITVLIYIFR